MTNSGDKMLLKKDNEKYKNIVDTEDIEVSDDESLFIANFLENGKALKVEDVLKLAKDLYSSFSSLYMESDLKYFYYKVIEAVKKSKEGENQFLFICYDNSYAIPFFVKVHNMENYYCVEIITEKQKIEEITEKSFLNYKKINLVDKEFELINFDMVYPRNYYTVTKQTKNKFSIESIAAGKIALDLLRETYGDKAEEEISRFYLSYNFKENGDYTTLSYLANRKNPEKHTSVEIKQIQLLSNKENKQLDPLVIEELKRLNNYSKEYKEANTHAISKRR